MNIIDGRAIAEAEKLRIYEAVQALPSPLTLAIITCAPNFATSSYLELKKKTATALGIKVDIITLPETATTADVVTVIKSATTVANGVVVQLPLPSQIDVPTVLEAIPESHDVDNFRYHGEETNIYPPVVSAIDKISTLEKVIWLGAKVVIFGEGKLVGRPMLAYALAKGAAVSVITTETKETEVQNLSKQADIIVLGAGQANLLRSEMVKEGVVIFDAGASEDGGVLVGDAERAIAGKAKLFTPVPGGIGPVTVSALFHNLLELALRQ